MTVGTARKPVPTVMHAAMRPRRCASSLRRIAAGSETFRHAPQEAPLRAFGRRRLGLDGDAIVPHQQHRGPAERQRISSCPGTRQCAHNPRPDDEFWPRVVRRGGRTTAVRVVKAEAEVYLVGHPGGVLLLDPPARPDRDR